MNSINATTTFAVDEARPEVTRIGMLRSMLVRSGRGGVPIRTEFVQSRSANADHVGSGPLASLVKNHDATGLDAYLLIHAMASAEPWECRYPSSSWVTALGLDRHAETTSARATFSKALKRLAALSLLDLKETGRRPRIELLREDGSGHPYFRPRNVGDGVWFSLPYTYWTQGYVDALSLPGKATLLIAMSLNDHFILPFDRAPVWYGMSAKTAERGFRELRHLQLISHQSEFRVEPTSAIGVAEVRKYLLEGPFSTTARKTAMMRPRREEHVAIARQADEPR